MKVNTDPTLIDQFLERGVENVFPSKDFVRARLTKGEQLTMYLGIDPTGPTLHLGHMIPLRKLRQFQELGHKVILLIGDFTGMIGDPTDKSAARKRLTREQVLENAKLYKEQASKILNFDGENSAELKFNSEWLAKMSFADVVELCAHYTVQQMMKRDMFEKRIRGQITCPSCHQLFLASSFQMQVPDQARKTDKDGKMTNLIAANHVTMMNDSGKLQEEVCTHCGKKVGDVMNYKPIPASAEEHKAWFEFRSKIIHPTPVFLHEFLYPLMQGYDSVAMDIDGEVGGNDQTFNMLVGRTLMKEISQKEKFVIGMKLLVDNTGKKMGKTEGNMVTMADDPNDMFGKVMSWPDEMLRNGFLLLTNDELASHLVGDKTEVQMGLSVSQVNDVISLPSWMEEKQRLARLVVASVYGSDLAEKAAEHFHALFQKHEIPTDIPELSLDADSTIVDVLITTKLVMSKTQARQVLDEGGVKIDGEVVKDYATVVKPGQLIQKGKRHFVRTK